MEHKKFLVFGLFFIILISLVLSTIVFAPSYDFTESDSITCGNGFCEHLIIQFDSIGQEKEAFIAGETYRIKIVEKIDKGEGKYSVILNVNGEEVTSEVEGDESTSADIQGKFGFNVDTSNITKGVLAIDVHEPYIKGCAVPDCDTGVELDVYEKWNLVPILFLVGSSGGTRIKGTCTLEDFLVIYGYNPVQNEYMMFHSYGKNTNDFRDSIMSVGENGLLEGITVNTLWNSVWVYSLSECKLTGEISGRNINFLSSVAEVREQGIQVNFASGWNFWAGSKDMEGKSFDDIKGDCEIEKAYTFEALSQSWKKLESPPGLATNFLFKVKNSCMFREKIPEVPAIPEAPVIPDAPSIPE